MKECTVLKSTNYDFGKMFMPGTVSYMHCMQLSKLYHWNFFQNPWAIKYGNPIFMDSMKIIWIYYGLNFNCEFHSMNFRFFPTQCLVFYRACNSCI